MTPIRKVRRSLRMRTQSTAAYPTGQVANSGASDGTPQCGRADRGSRSDGRQAGGWHVSDLLTIVGLGDSTTAGTPGFQSPLEAPPNGRGDETSQYAYWLMRSQPSWRVLNRGVNGERSDEIRARFQRDVLRATPHAVVVIAGVNDIYQGRSAALVARELDAMYTAARAARIPLVAGSIIPYNTATDEANARMHDVNDWIRGYVAAHPREAVFCDTRAAVADPAAPERLASSPDDLHPSSDGYRRMAVALEPAIAQALALV
jgi:lysophospholipase L1-like esterase